MANPYSGGGNATTGGGGGGWNTLTSDTLPPSGFTAPALNALNLFTTTYAVNLPTLEIFREFYWNIIGDLINLFTGAKDAVVSLYCLPITPSEISGTEYRIALGRFDSNFHGKIPSNQFIVKSFGTVDIEKYSGSFLDYEGTQISLYLPYIGTVDLDPKIVMGHSLWLYYVIDLYSGNMTAMIYVGEPGNFNLAYQFNGNCIYTLPFSSADFTEMTLNTMKAAASIYSSILTAVMAL